MKSHILMAILLVNVPLSISQAENITVNNLLQDYVKQGASTADAEQGKQLWQKTFNNNGERSCASCHTKDLTQNGKHIKTNKDIKPMSPSANPERLTDRKKINKWFKRNCKWTLGRECTAQEKTNFLVYIKKSSKF
jgi:cytochrome c peroxidase